jgi:hypothetical protein
VRSINELIDRNLAHLEAHQPAPAFARNGVAV